jgi:hypothetical protein
MNTVQQRAGILFSLSRELALVYSCKVHGNTLCLAMPFYLVVYHVDGICHWVYIMKVAKWSLASVGLSY